MPGIGGFFGWNEPPPAAITTTLQRKIETAIGRELESAVVVLARAR